MQKNITFVVFMLTLGSIMAQNEPIQPFESIGKKVKVLTMSNGKYQETFPNDSIMRIGSVMYNRNTGEVVSTVEHDTLYGEYDLKPEVVSRWLSTDPLGNKFPNWSPYNYTLNNPVRLVDPDGQAPGDPNLGFGFHLSVSITSGGAYFRGGVSLSASQNIGSNVSVAAVANANAYFGGVGTASGRGFGYDASFGGAITAGGGQGNPLPQYIGNSTSASSLQNSFENSGTLGQTFIYSSGIEEIQRNGVIGGKFGDFAFSSHNDTRMPFLGDGGDRGFTGGLRLSANLGNGGLLEGGTEVYTGIPNRPKNQGYDPGLGLRNYAQGPDKNLNNGLTFLNYSSNGASISLFSQGKGNLWFQRAIHNHATKNKLFTEEQTRKTEFGVGGGGSN
jgi:RHS repeat-associated protein